MGSLNARGLMMRGTDESLDAMDHVRHIQVPVGEEASNTSISLVAPNRVYIKLHEAVSFIFYLCSHFLFHFFILLPSLPISSPIPTTHNDLPPNLLLQHHLPQLKLHQSPPHSRLLYHPHLPTARPAHHGSLLRLQTPLAPLLHRQARRMARPQPSILGQRRREMD